MIDPPPGSTIEDVKAFWDAHPLFTGEAQHVSNTLEFFEEHKRTIVQDGFAGILDEQLFPKNLACGPVLDLGCGVGFWLPELWTRGARSLIGADLSVRSLAIAQQRCAAYGVATNFVNANAEQLPFPDNTFAHVNCQGVIHHTAFPRRATQEIARVLKPGGTAMIAVYYRNMALRAWPLLRMALKFVPIGLPGRGRDKLSALHDANDIIRRFDGAENPIGLAYGRSEFRDLIAPLVVQRIFYHFFPARALPFKLASPLHRALDRRLPFMIFAMAQKR